MIGLDPRPRLDVRHRAAVSRAPGGAGVVVASTGPHQHPKTELPPVREHPSIFAREFQPAALARVFAPIIAPFLRMPSNGAAVDGCSRTATRSCKTSQSFGPEPQTSTRRA